MDFATNLLTVASIGILVVIAYLHSQRKPKNFPPGPWGFPLIGHLPYLGPEPFRAAIKWLPKYGPIVGIDFACYPAIYITGHKLIKEALAELAFSGRPKLQMNIDRGGGQIHGVIASEGRMWREQRRFTHRTLRDFGFGTMSMESIILTEAQDLIEGLKPHAGKPISNHYLFNIAVLNAIWTIVAGERFRHDDPELNRVSHTFTRAVGEVNAFAMLSIFMPWLLKYGPNWLSHAKELEQTYKPVNELLKPIIDQHFETHEPGQPRDFIDAYIDEMKATTDPSSSFNNRMSILITVSDLFVGALETSSTTLTWLVLMFAAHPEVQRNVAEEIGRVVGWSRAPSLTDRPQMPFTEAAIYEIMRSRTLFPNGVFHSTTEDVQFHGYSIPKDTMVFFNIFEAHNNEKLWDDPENFRPERFLSENGSILERREGFMPFSTGKHICLGEKLARDTLFLFTTSFFQAFHVGVDPNGPPPNTEYKIRGTVPVPSPHKLLLSVRHNVQ